MEDRVAARPGVTADRGHARRSGRSSPPALLAATLLCLSLAACNGSGKGSASLTSSAGASSSSTATTTTPSPAANTASGGGAAGGSAAGTALASPIPTGDQDGDSPNNMAFDKDDSFITTFGHAAAPSDRSTITALVKRYYAAIASADGATACSLLFFVITESAPETYGQTAADATAGRGKSCGPVLSKVFKGSRQQLLTENRYLKVIAIRVQHRRAWVLLRFGPESVRRIVVYREGATWKIGELTDTELV
jgi:hypothetical protein